MDMETLENFLVIARENNVTRAAQIIHITQPTLSRQLKALEEELGRPLFYRENRRLSLTPEGILFRKRAEELLDLYRKTRSEIRASTEIAGDIFLGTGETDVIRLISQVAVGFSRQHPGIRYRIFSSDAEGVRERLNKGLLDLGLVYGPSDPKKFASVPLDQEDRWGILLPRTHPLAAEPGLSPEQVRDLPLILSQQALKSGLLLKWLGKPPGRAEHHRYLHPSDQCGENGGRGPGLCHGPGRAHQHRRLPPVLPALRSAPHRPSVSDLEKRPPVLPGSPGLPGTAAAEFC